MRYRAGNQLSDELSLQRGWPSISGKTANDNVISRLPFLMITDGWRKELRLNKKKTSYSASSPENWQISDITWTGRNVLDAQRWLSLHRDRYPGLEVFTGFTTAIASLFKDSPALKASPAIENGQSISVKSLHFDHGTDQLLSLSPTFITASELLQLETADDVEEVDPEEDSFGTIAIQKHDQLAMSSKEASDEDLDDSSVQVTTALSPATLDLLDQDEHQTVLGEPGSDKTRKMLKDRNIERLQTFKIDPLRFGTKHKRPLCDSYIASDRYMHPCPWRIESSLETCRLKRGMVSKYSVTILLSTKCTGCTTIHRRELKRHKRTKRVDGQPGCSGRVICWKSPLEGHRRCVEHLLDDTDPSVAPPAVKARIQQILVSGISKTYTGAQALLAVNLLDQLSIDTEFGHAQTKDGRWFRYITELGICDNRGNTLIDFVSRVACRNHPTPSASELKLLRFKLQGIFSRPRVVLEWSAGRCDLTLLREVCTPKGIPLFDLPSEEVVFNPMAAWRDLVTSKDQRAGYRLEQLHPLIVPDSPWRGMNHAALADAHQLREMILAYFELRSLYMQQNRGEQGQ